MPRTMDSAGFVAGFRCAWSKVMSVIWLSSSADGINAAPKAGGRSHRSSGRS